MCVETITSKPGLFLESSGDKLSSFNVPFLVILLADKSTRKQMLKEVNKNFGTSTMRLYRKDCFSFVQNESLLKKVHCCDAFYPNN